MLLLFDSGLGCCRKEIARTIIMNGANYVLAVKLNQPIFYVEIKEYFAWAREDSIEKSIWMYIKQ